MPMALREERKARFIKTASPPCREAVLLQVDKPNSVTLRQAQGVYHLSRPDITDRLYLPTLRQGRAALWSVELTLPVYMAFQPTRFIPFWCCHQKACALTARFHPYPSTSLRVNPFGEYSQLRFTPSEAEGRLFSATLAVSLHERTHPLGGVAALCCPDFPHLITISNKTR